MITISNVPYTMSKMMEPRVNNYKLVGEYTDKSVDGINTLLGEYSVVFQDTKENIESLDSQLSILNSTTQFEWKPYKLFLPSLTAQRFICSEWETDYQDVGKSTLTTTFYEQPIL